MVDYPFLCGRGQLAHLRFPEKLEKADAERLARVRADARVRAGTRADGGSGDQE